MIEKYYEEELRYLYESGREFATAHPDRARFLNIDAVGDRDPYVERLFEGFAFLAGRIREKIDDSFPEITEGLLDLMWPALMEEVPSMCIMEFAPRDGIINETRTIQQGAEILSEPLGAESIMCKFTTAFDVPIHPMRLTNVSQSHDNRGKSSLTFTFDLSETAALARCNLDPLRIYLHAEMPIALMLHEFLTQRVEKVSLSTDTGISCEIPASTAVSPAGLTAEESLLPTDTRTYWGFGLLREYFINLEKFLFIDIHGLSAIQSSTTVPKTITYTVTFKSGFPADKPFTARNFRLYCVPAVNLFTADAEPILHEGHKPEYTVIANASAPHSMRIARIVNVTGADNVTGERFTYEPFTSFKNIGIKNRRLFAARFRYNAAGQRICSLSPTTPSTQGVMRPESLSIVALMSNGPLPREEIRENGLTRPGSGIGDYVRITNITRPTYPTTPPAQEDFLWMFLAHTGATYSSLADKDTLKTCLRLYDWSRNVGRAARIEAIYEVLAKPQDAVVKGSVVRGVRFSITLTESHFADMNDMHLFGLVLREFLAHYVSLNSFVEVALIGRPSGDTMVFSSLEGRQWLI